MGSAATAHTASPSSFFSRGMSSRSRLREIDGDGQADTRTTQNSEHLRASTLSSFPRDLTPISTVRDGRGAVRGGGGGGGVIISSHNLLEINPDEINFILPGSPPQLNLCPATFRAIQLKDGGREEQQGD